MSNNPSNQVAKVHPASREMLPEDPMGLHAVELPGDADLMLRLMVEEYARMGWGLDAILALAEDPFYHVLHDLYQQCGPDEFRRRVQSVLDRVGVARIKTVEAPVAPNEPDALYQLDEESLPSPKEA